MPGRCLCHASSVSITNKRNTTRVNFVLEPDLSCTGLQTHSARPVSISLMTFYRPALASASLGMRPLSAWRPEQQRVVLRAEGESTAAGEEEEDQDTPPGKMKVSELKVSGRLLPSTQALVSREGRHRPVHARCAGAAACTT
jgi:hypothetical protein